MNYKINFAFAVFAVIISLGLAKESKNFTSIPEALADAEKYIAKFNETYNIPSLVFGLSIKGIPVWQKAWGYADLENYVPAKVDTRYVLASLSKTFTSILIGTLVDQGLLQLDDPITRYVNEATYPHKKWEDKPVNITIRQLLSHTAGLPENGAKTFLTTESAQNVTQALHLFNDDPLHSKPGSGFFYSNLGFELLGAAIESVTKKPYQQVFTDFMHKHGLVSSYAGNRSILLHNIARYYKSPEKGPAKENVPALLNEIIDTKAYWPAGGIISNVPDLIDYGQLLVDSYKGLAKGTNAISQATLKQLWTTQVRNIPTQAVYYLHYDYALGWFAASDNANLKYGHIVGHQGSGLGCSAMLLIYPDEEIVAVALTNKAAIFHLDQVITHIVENVYPLVELMFKPGNPWIGVESTAPFIGAGWWKQKHEGILNQTKNHAADIKAVFLGDSITDGWANNGMAVWNQHYANRGAVNYGIGGDRTENVLWRIEHGEFDNINPKVVVIMIGTNNISAKNSPADIAKGVKAILDQLHQKMPTTHLLILSVLPRNTPELDVKDVHELNKLVSTFADNKLIHYLDIGSHFERSLAQVKTELYQTDQLHLSTLGYEMWYRQMEPTFARLLA